MFFTILLHITLPIFLMIGVGVWFNKTFKPDIATLTRLSFNVLLPSLVFTKTVDAQLSGDIWTAIFALNILHTLLIFGLGWLVYSFKGVKGHRACGTLAIATPNSGNYGIPLAALAFGAFGANVMAIIVLIQIFFTITLGIWLMDKNPAGLKERLAGLIKTPLLWAGALGLLFAALHIQVPQPLNIALNSISDALVPIALITLGIQLGRSQVQGEWKTLSLIGAMRLLLAPALALLLNLAWEWLGGSALGDAGAVLVISAGMPVAVNVFILASEYRNDSDLASRSIFWTTILSALTLTAIIALYK